MKKVSKQLLIVALQLALALAIAELAARFLFADLTNDETYLDLAYAQIINSTVVVGEGKGDLDPKFGFRPKPNYEFAVTTGEYSFSGKTNSLGFRTREIEPARDGEYRLMLVGDSMFWGIGVNDLATIPAVIEREGGKDVKAFNYSVTGYNTVQEYLVAENNLGQVRPNHLILGFFVGNDIVPNAVSNIDANGNYTVSTEEESKIRDDLRGRLGVLFYSTLYRKLSLNGYMPRVRYQIASHPDLINRSFEMIAKMKALAKANNARFSVVVLYPRDSVEGGVKEWWSNSRNVGALVVSYCRENSIDVLDTLPVMTGPERRSAYYFPNDGHYNEAGSEVVGIAIARELIRPNN